MFRRNLQNADAGLHCRPVPKVNEACQTQRHIVVQRVAGPAPRHVATMPSVKKSLRQISNTALVDGEPNTIASMNLGFKGGGDFVVFQFIVRSFL